MEVKVWRGGEGEEEVEVRVIEMKGKEEMKEGKKSGKMKEWRLKNGMGRWLVNCGKWEGRGEVCGKKKWKLIIWREEDVVGGEDGDVGKEFEVKWKKKGDMEMEEGGDGEGVRVVKEEMGKEIKGGGREGDDGVVLG